MLRKKIRRVDDVRRGNCCYTSSLLSLSGATHFFRRIVTYVMTSIRLASFAAQFFLNLGGDRSFRHT